MSKELDINSKIYIPKNKIIKNENEISKTNFSDNEDISEDSEYINNLKYKNIFISDVDSSSNNNISRTNSITDNNANQNNFKFSIDLPNVSKSRLHEYLNNDLIESLEKISPEISRKETKKEVPNFQLSEPESENNNKNQDEENEKENYINFLNAKNNNNNNNLNSLNQNNFLNNLNQFNNNLFFNNLQIDNNGIIKNNTFMNNIENNNNNNNNNNKKIFKIREGDWNCFNCNNLNFSFRTKCNRCGMTKIISMKKFNKLNYQQNPILNNNYFNKYVYNQEINNINFINL